MKSRLFSKPSPQQSDKNHHLFHKWVLFFKEVAQRPLSPEWTKWWTSILLPLGLFLSTATRLRFSEIPIGISEIMLVIVMFINGPSIIQSLEKWKAHKLFYIFWGSFFLFGFLGIFCFKSNLTINQFILKDSLAYGYIFLLTIFFMGNIDQNKQALKAVIILYTLSSLVFIGYDALFQTKIFHPHMRFLGLSMNPNQIALALAPIPFLCLHYAFEKNISGNLKLFWILLIIGSLYVGAQNKSISLLSGLGIFGIGEILVKVFNKKYEKLFIFTSTIIFIFIFFSLLYLNNIWSGVLYEFEVRTYFASIAFKALQDTYFLGKGIGTYIVYAGAAYDSHNSLLSIFLNSGFITGGIALILLGIMFRKIFKTRNYFIAFAFLNTLFFICAHSLIRHPILWFYLIACYQIPRRQDKALPVE